ncbi:MAG: hypothetical protein ABL955_06465, partial [Elusimicrobiota bacterium]
DWIVGEGKLKVPIVDMAQGAEEVSVTGDPARARAARRDWLERLNAPPAGFEGFQKKIGFFTPLLGPTITLQDKILFNLAGAAFKKADYRKALSLLDRLSPVLRSKPYVLRLRGAVEQSARERVD